jgi:hypothetical protein
MERPNRGEVLLAPDPYPGKSGWRPFAVISDETYPFWPDGCLGVPVTTNDRPNTVEILESEIERELLGLDVKPSFINPYSPTQINETGKTLCILSNKKMDAVAMDVARATGLNGDEGP